MIYRLTVEFNFLLAGEGRGGIEEIMLWQANRSMCVRSGTALAILLTHIVQPLSYNETNNNYHFNQFWLVDF